MLLAAISIAWTVTVALLLTRAARQARWYQSIDAAAEQNDSHGPEDPVGSVAVIVPARNEALNLPTCLSTLLVQDYLPRVLIVANDQSTDGTADLVRALSTQHDRLKLIDVGPLPAGWTGKTHACSIGASAAGDVEWLCFIDADTQSNPGLLRRALDVASRRDLALLSLSPFQIMQGPWERLIVPAGFFFVAFSQDLSRTLNPSSPQAQINGQFLLIRRRVYESIGGFEAVRECVAEDSAIARAVKQSGGRIALLGAEHLIRTRMYRDFGSLWQGLSRQAGEIVGSAPLAAAWAIAALLLGLAAPLVTALDAASAIRGQWHLRSALPLYLGLPGTLSLLGAHIAAARRFGIPIVYGLFYPLGYVLGSGVLFNSVLQRRRRRVPWKGREYVPVVSGVVEWRS